MSEKLFIIPKSPEEIICERDKEIKKLLEDKVRILEKLVELHEKFNKQPFFMIGGNPNEFQEVKE